MDSRLSCEGSHPVADSEGGKARRTICSWQEKARCVLLPSPGCGLREENEEGLTVQRGLAGQELGLLSCFPHPRTGLWVFLKMNSGPISALIISVTNAAFSSKKKIGLQGFTKKPHTVQ